MPTFTYPNRLFPTPNDQKIFKLNLTEHLIRWTCPDYPLKDSEGRLHALAIEEKRLFHYSVNKIPRSEIEDVFIEFDVREPFLDKWEEGKICPPVGDSDFKWEKDRGYFIIPIANIHEHLGRYPFPADNDTFNCEFLVKVVHAPLMANFMHFELHIFDNEGNLLSEVKKKTWRKIIVAEIRQHLIEVAKFSI
ncbi:MAG: hypothetical protein KDD27_28045 [Saprospiraceae bacterium]|nr:hypothetical protein [Saprospiraceae bacterium]